MAYYQYYQTGAPAWGTSNYQFAPPPMPNYVPQPSWSGVDYYQAHAGAQDSSLFDYVWSKLRSVVTGVSVSRGEAEHWHNRVYGGLVQVSALMPREIGAAAGWETVRLWQSHNSIYRSPLSGEREREREALVGLAIAEASRLWQYTGRPMDKYGRREASEVAAATAARVFTQLYDYDTPYDSYNQYDNYSYGTQGRRRRNSFYEPEGSVSGGYAPSMTGSYRSPSPNPMAAYRSPSPNPMGTPIPVPGGASPYNAPAYLPAASPYGSQMYQSGGVSPYASSMPLSPSPYQGQYYSGGLTYEQQQAAMATAPGTVIIHTDSGRSHRHHHHHRRSYSRHRHRRSNSGGSYHS